MHTHLWGLQAPQFSWLIRSVGMALISHHACSLCEFVDLPVEVAFLSMNRPVTAGLLTALRHILINVTLLCLLMRQKKPPADMEVLEAHLIISATG